MAAKYRCGGGKIYDLDNPRLYVPRIRSAGGKVGGAGISINGAFSFITTITLMPGDKYLYINNIASSSALSGADFIPINYSGIINGSVAIKNSKTIELPDISEPTSITIRASNDSSWDQADTIRYAVDFELKVY